MQKNIWHLFSLLFFCNCFGQIKFDLPKVDPISIQSNFRDWQNYQNKNIMLSRNFVALDAKSNVITKEDFLNQLALGNLIPLQMQTNNELLCYKLFKIESTSDTSIKATISQIAFDEKEHLSMEGISFPKFHFADLNENIISNETMKGKIIVIKCWYINCAACIKEFPDVNKLVEKYKTRADIQFVSLAEDTSEQLKSFLAKKPLLYSVIPNMKMYMNEILHLNAFPTHYILNKNGMIAKVLSNYESLEAALEIESKK